MKYGFAAKIRVPLVPPTGSGNQFTIEFGYNEMDHIERLEAGVMSAPLVRKIINGYIDYTTGIVGLQTDLTFTLRTITPIPVAGGIMIMGPRSFRFDEFCQPKPYKGSPDFPYDSTCLYAAMPTGEPKVTIIAGPQGIPANDYKFSLAAQNPPDALTSGFWTILSLSLMSERTALETMKEEGLVLDANTTIQSFPVGIPMYLSPTTGLSGTKFIMHKKRVCLPIITEPNLPETYCDFEHWQFFRPWGYRDDRPGKPTHLIFQIQLSGDSDGTKDIVMKAPEGYEFNAECTVVTYPSAKIFDDRINDDRILELHPLVNEDPTLAPLNGRRFDSRYTLWPQAAEVLLCVGSKNRAYITVRDGLKKRDNYLMRLSVLRNPERTPDPNMFTLEYNGETSEPFEGIEIWAFKNGTILPTTTASSVRSDKIINPIRITLMPVNDIPPEGHLRINAPSGFIFATDCPIVVTILDGPNASAVSAGLERQKVLDWSEFLPGEVQCVGDVTPTSRAKLYFNSNKYLKAGYVYVFETLTLNPETTSATPVPWVFKSYEDRIVTTENLLDSATIPGFAINSVVPSFMYLTPQSLNANAWHELDVNMSFPGEVAVGDKIEMIAPIAYFLNEQGSALCMKYTFLEGSLRRTKPRCSANTISWVLEEESVPGGSSIRFILLVRNPPETPMPKETRNLFQLKQTGADYSRKASRMIAGFEIIPKLTEPSVSQVPPVESCRIDVNVITNQVCQGASSRSAVILRFTPTRSGQLVKLEGKVGNTPFDFTNAHFREDPAEPPTYARSPLAVVAVFAVHAGVEETLRIDSIENPNVFGKAKFSITTFTTDPVVGLTTTTTVTPLRACEDSGPCGLLPISEARRDESLDLESFDILGYIRVLTSSRVSPIYYAAPAATITMEMEIQYPVHTGEIFRMTRPPGFALKDGSLKTFLGLVVAAHGLDYQRVFSSDYDNPEDYYMIVAEDMAVDTVIVLTVESVLPSVPNQQMNWAFRTYRLSPDIDTDGEILDDSLPPYPWINVRDGLRRPYTITGTNDGAFGGFLLVGQIPFNVDYSMQTPGADIRLKLVFGIAEEISADNNLRLDITGPLGFVFRDSCLASVPPQFTKCTGFRNTARLVATQPRLKGTDITVYLAVTNPGTTPSPNYWTVAVFQDASTQYGFWSTELGKEIRAMPVVYKGNNQLGESASGFFTFTPMRPSPSPILQIEIRPPANMGYRLFCTGVSPLGFMRMPQCTSGGVNSNLMLKFDNATLVAEQAYTVGIRIYNPGGRPGENQNNWGLSLKDHNGQTFDANLVIPGLDLKSLPIRCNGLGWTTAAPRVLAQVLIQLRVLFTLTPGTITNVVIRAPDGIMYNEDTSAVRVIPIPLPLLAARPSRVRGDLLELNIDTTQAIGIGLYNIRFEVSNPSVYPHDNTWSIFVKKDVEIDYAHVLTGYVPGQVSPFDLAAAASTVGAASRRWALAATRWAAIVAGALVLHAAALPTASA